MLKSTQQDAETLEALIDRVGAEETLNLIAAICASKAEHVRASYNDRQTARAWDQVGAAVSEVADFAQLVS